MENLYRVSRLARGYRFVQENDYRAFVIGPTFGQVYPAERTAQGIVLDLRGPGVLHFHEHHASATAV